MKTTATFEKPEVLSGWKEIANYLGKGVRTVQRYEWELGLPVRRPAGKPRGSVIATRAELDAWVMASPVREAIPVLALPTNSRYGALWSVTRNRIAQMNTLLDQSRALHDEVMAFVRKLEAIQSARGSCCMSLRSVLVVEDYEPFCRFICSALGKRSELRIVAEVSDGLEAVKKAQELQPDLILLDVGLPALNGIAAARQIRKLSPESKILFVSQESSPDVVQEALTIGALGYIAKTNTRLELLPAVEAVCLGRRFVSPGLAGHVPAELAG